MGSRVRKRSVSHLLALFPFTDSVWQIYALIFSINAVTAFFTPTFEAMLPDVAGLDAARKAAARELARRAGALVAREVLGVP